jgi:hypothetical protein
MKQQHNTAIPISTLTPQCAETKKAASSSDNNKNSLNNNMATQQVPPNVTQARFSILQCTKGLQNQTLCILVTRI